MFTIKKLIYNLIATRSISYKYKPYRLSIVISLSKAMSYIIYSISRSKAHELTRYEQYSVYLLFLNSGENDCDTTLTKKQIRGGPPGTPQGPLQGIH